MNTEQTKVDKARELSPDDALQVFADPIPYLLDFGLEAKMVALISYPLADAA